MDTEPSPLDKNLSVEGRLTKLENSLTGVQTGQTALRQHIDHGFAEMKTLVENSTQSPPLRVVEWVLIMLAGTNLLMVIVVLIVAIDYYSAG